MSRRSHPHRSFAHRLHEELEGIRSEYRKVLDRSSIRNVDPNLDSSDFIFIGFADWDWTPDEDLIGDRTRLCERVNEWADLLSLLHRGAVPSTSTRMDENLDLLRGWLIRDGGDHSIPPTLDQAHAKAEAAFDDLARLIEVGVHGPAGLVVLPDTNALLRQPDVAAFAGDLGSDDYLVVMLTTVVSELDDLKDRGRTDDVRTKAMKAVRRLKGLRDRGDVRSGIVVQGRIRLRMEHREVDVRGVLGWLDPDTPDDRILAGALDVQAKLPATTVVLLTADMNMQNKATAVGLPFVDPSP